MGNRKPDCSDGYDEVVKDRLIFIEMMARDGMTNEQIAKNLGIRKSTLYNWKKQHPEFAEALRYGRYETNLEVENKLLELCRGGKSKSVTVTEDTAPVYENGVFVGNRTTKTTVTSDSQDKPDFRAIAFYLYNNCPENYRERKRDVLSNGDDKVEIVDDIDE